MAIPFSTLQYPRLPLSSEEGAGASEKASDAPTPSARSTGKPYGFFGRSHVHKGAVPRSKRRRYGKGKQGSFA